MSDCSRSSSMNSKKRRIDEIDDTIAYLSNEVNKFDDYALRSEFETSILSLKLKRERVKAVAAAARFQVLLADMEVVSAENDLLTDVERLKKYKRRKLDGGKDEPFRNGQEPIQRTMKSTAVQTSSDDTNEIWNPDGPRRTPTQFVSEVIQPQCTANGPSTTKIDSPASHSDDSTVLLKSMVIQTSNDNISEGEHMEWVNNGPRSILLHSDNEAVWPQLVIQPQFPSNGPSTTKIDSVTNHSDNLVRLLTSTAAQTSSENRSVVEHMKWNFNGPRSTVLHSDSGTVQPQPSNSPSTMKKDCAINCKNVTELLKPKAVQTSDNYTSEQPNLNESISSTYSDWETILQQSSSTKKDSTTNRKEDELELLKPTPVQTTHDKMDDESMEWISASPKISPINSDTGKTQPPPSSNTPCTKKDTKTKHKSNTSKQAAKTPKDKKNKDDKKKSKPVDPKKKPSNSKSGTPQSQSTKTPTTEESTTKHIPELMKVITEYEWDRSLSTSMKTELNKRYTTAQSQENASTHTGTDTSTKGKKRKRSKSSKRNQESPAKMPKPGTTMKTIAENRTAFSPKPSTQNAIVRSNTSMRTSAKHKMPMTVSRPYSMGPSPIPLNWRTGPLQPPLLLSPCWRTPSANFYGNY